jgi:hypothetical protein
MRDTAPQISYNNFSHGGLTMTREQLLEMPEVLALLRAAFDAGFDSSGEGYNGSYPFGLMETPEYAAMRERTIGVRLLGEPE